MLSAERNAAGKTVSPFSCRISGSACLWRSWAAPSRASRRERNQTPRARCRGWTWSASSGPAHTMWTLHSDDMAAKPQCPTVKDLLSGTDFPVDCLVHAGAYRPIQDALNLTRIIFSPTCQMSRICWLLVLADQTQSEPKMIEVYEETFTPFLRDGRGFWTFLVTLWPLLRPTAMLYRIAMAAKRKYEMKHVSKTIQWSGKPDRWKLEFVRSPPQTSKVHHNSVVWRCGRKNISQPVKFLCKLFLKLRNKINTPLVECFKLFRSINPSLSPTIHRHKQLLTNLGEKCAGIHKLNCLQNWGNDITLCGNNTTKPMDTDFRQIKHTDWKRLTCSCWLPVKKAARWRDKPEDDFQRVFGTTTVKQKWHFFVDLRHCLQV